EVVAGADADAPDVLLLGGAQPAETARTSGLELDARALADVVERGLLALRLVGEGRVVRVIEQHLDLLVRLVHARPVAGEEAHDRRHLVGADAAPAPPRPSCP